MNLIIQGMRRSGTTILYDALCQDPQLTSWYEPLAAAVKPAMGGGSGMQQHDLFENLRSARERFAREEGLDNIDVFNYGAPKDAALEFAEDLPPVIIKYLQFLYAHPGAVMAKFTRLYRKMHLLADIIPDAVCVHLVRDPRAVTSSYLFGKNQRNKKLFPTVDSYFSRQSERSAWSSLTISDLILFQPGWKSYADLLDFERILLIWRFTFEETRCRGLAAFGERYLLVRHEALCSDPVGQLKLIYNHVGLMMPEAVKIWALKHIKAVSVPHAADDPRWRASFNKLDLDEALYNAGYFFDKHKL